LRWACTTPMWPAGDIHASRRPGVQQPTQQSVCCVMRRSPLVCSCAHQLACKPGSSRSCPVGDHGQCLPTATCHPAATLLGAPCQPMTTIPVMMAAPHQRHTPGAFGCLRKRKPKCRLTTYVCIYPRTCCNNLVMARVNTKSSVVPADKAGCLSPTWPHAHSRHELCAPGFMHPTSSDVRSVPPMCGSWRPLWQTQPGEVWSACSRRVCRTDGGTL
jgi:hypothetical protein